MISRTRRRSVDPSRCWFPVHQGQRTNPILMGISQDLQYLVLVSTSVGGRCVLDLQSKLKTLSWVTVLWSLAWLAVWCSNVPPTWWSSRRTPFASSLSFLQAFQLEDALEYTLFLTSTRLNWLTYEHSIWTPFSFASGMLANSL